MDGSQIGGGGRLLGDRHCAADLPSSDSRCKVVLTLIPQMRKWRGRGAERMAHTS